jgi:type II secretory pathway pseudopilin PulG
MLARARSQAGFTTIELLLAILISTVGVISLVGTLDVSRRVTTYSEMKEAAAHVAEQKMEELRALDYGELALDGDVVPSSSSDPNNPAHYLQGGGTSYLWDQREDAPASHTAEPLVVDATDGKVESIAESWDDGRISGNVYRYVTCASAAAEDCDQGADTSAYKRIIVAVTVENKFGPKKPIAVSTLVSDPNLANGEGADPLESPGTFCTDPDTGEELECTKAATGTVSTWYLYDTPATNSTRQEVIGSHATHPTVAATGDDCEDEEEDDSEDCPVPDLMGIDPPPAPEITPPVYNYSNEITGGTTPGGAVVRRDTTCTGGTPTTTDNTKGHMWVTPPLAEPMSMSDVGLSVSTQTFNGATADAMLCVALYDVPNSITNLVAEPPTLLVSKGGPITGLTAWPTSASEMAFVLELFEAGTATIAAGHRLGLRIWTSSSAGADLVVLYDHPLHLSYLQVSG